MLVLRRYGLLFAGLLMLLVGGIVLIVGVDRCVPMMTIGYGETAYAPLEATPYWVSPMSQIVTGVVLMVLGLAAAAIWFVVWLNRNRSA